MKISGRFYFDGEKIDIEFSETTMIDPLHKTTREKRLEIPTVGTSLNPKISEMISLFQEILSIR